MGRSVTNIIASKQTYPSTAQMRGEEGTAKVKVYIGADGAVQRPNWSQVRARPSSTRKPSRSPPRWAGSRPAGRPDHADGADDLEAGLILQFSMRLHA
jgi:protein TonB